MHPVSSSFQWRSHQGSAARGSLQRQGTGATTERLIMWQPLQASTAKGPRQCLQYEMQPARPQGWGHHKATHMVRSGTLCRLKPRNHLEVLLPCRSAMSQVPGRLGMRPHLVLLAFDREYIACAPVSLGSDSPGRRHARLLRGCIVGLLQGLGLGNCWSGCCAGLLLQLGGFLLHSIPLVLQGTGHSCQARQGSQHCLARVMSATARLHNCLLLLGRKANNQLSCSTVHNDTLSHRWMGLGDCAGVRWVWAGSSPALTQHPACCLTCSLWVAAERRGPGRCPAPSPASGAPVSCLRAKSSLQPLGKGGSGCRAR